MNERNIFLAAVTRTTPADQAAYLNQACAGDAEMRQRLESLLQAHEQLRNFFDKPAGELIVAPERPSDHEGRRFDWLGGGAVVASALIFLVILVGVAAAVWWLLRGRAVEEELVTERERTEARRKADAEALEHLMKESNELEHLMKESNEFLIVAELKMILSELDLKDSEPYGSPLPAQLADRMDKAAEQLEAAGDRGPLITADWQYKLGKALLRRGEATRAIKLLDKARTARTEYLGASHADTIATIADLAVAHQSAGRIADALPLFEETSKLRMATCGPADPATQQAKENLAIAYNTAGRWSDAESLLRELLACRLQQHSDDWTTFHTKSLLGAALLGQKNYADAELQLVQGYEGMKQREAKIHTADKARIIQALERIVQLYEAWDKKDAAAKWKQTLDTERNALPMPN